MRHLARLPGLLLTAIRAVMAVAACALFVWMVAAVGAQVISRYLFSFPIAWATETATIAQIWMVLLGAGIAMRHGMHIGIDLLVRRLPRVVNLALDLVIAVLALWFFWVFFTGSFRLLRVGMVQTMPALGWSMVWAYLALPVAAAYFALEFVVAMTGKLMGAQPASAEAHLAEPSA